MPRPLLSLTTIAWGTFALADFTGKVVGISDGDTITVLNRTEQVKVRLDGIDCPETGRPWAIGSLRAL